MKTIICLIAIICTGLLSEATSDSFEPSTDPKGALLFHLSSQKQTGEIDIFDMARAFARRQALLATAKDYKLVDNFTIGDFLAAIALPSCSRVSLKGRLELCDALNKDDELKDYARFRCRDALDDSARFCLENLKEAEKLDEIWSEPEFVEQVREAKREICGFSMAPDSPCYGKHTAWEEMVAQFPVDSST